MYFAFIFFITHCSGEAVGKCERTLIGECCTGYIYNPEKSKCEECSTGLTGPNCSLQCRYPSYGRLCQQQCDCTEIYCNKIVGCVNIEKGDPSKPVLIAFVVILSLILSIISVKTLLAKGYFAKWKSIIWMNSNQEADRKSDTHFYVEILDNKNNGIINMSGNGSGEVGCDNM